MIPMASAPRERFDAFPIHDRAIRVCLLGEFVVLREGAAVALRKESKLEALIVALALQPTRSLARDALSAFLWPEIDPTYSVQSLHSLVYSLHKLRGIEDVIVFAGGYYRLSDAVGVDVSYFEAMADQGDRAIRRGDDAEAAAMYRAALALYQGDLCVGTDLHALMERERLRARYLSILARLGEQRARHHDPGAALAYAQAMLRSDPCREDAHRLAMRCHVALGERAQALRHYRLCEHALLAEFEARPQAETTELFNQIRLDQDAVRGALADTQSVVFRPPAVGRDVHGLTRAMASSAKN